ncbi:hypothetical protein RVIR1_05730 [Candidatus Rickettsiella viridis]|uniref:Uncharacterized protein n=2 Tax=Candidatus Rickettsiella viridis TaxID=676208 RepID=A0A2Z5UVI7_9COXI|nr:hypothetical protein RVIR1_05730 [Candidatus Rickettsiella viridis]
MEIVQTYQAHSQAKEPLSKTLDAVKRVVEKNKKILCMHRPYSFVSKLFNVDETLSIADSLFPLPEFIRSILKRILEVISENRVISYELVTNAENRIETLPTNLTTCDRVRSIAKP